MNIVTAYTDIEISLGQITVLFVYLFSILYIILSILTHFDIKQINNII